MSRRSAIFRRGIVRPGRRRGFPPSLNRTVGLTGVGSSAAVGTPTLTVGATTVALTGVAAARAVGTPTVAPGQVTISPTGVPSVRAVGTPLVNAGLVVVPPGIPSVRAIGSPTLTVGSVSISGVGGISSGRAVGALSVVRQIIPAGIPSTRSIGAPTLTAGSVTVTLSGIPTTQTVGVPGVALKVAPAGIGSTAAIGDLTIRLRIVVLGIPGTLTVGAPAVLVGTVTITPLGIPSAEAVGVPRLAITLDVAARSSRSGVRVTAGYELVCVHRISQVSGPPVLLDVDPIDWVGLSYTDELSRPQRLDASCTIASLTDPVIQRVRQLDELASELHLFRDGRLIFAGPWLGTLVQGETLTLQAVGLLGYLRFWPIATDLVFAGVDQHLIAKGLIDYYQSLEHGNYGIDTSGITPSGQLRDATYLRNELHPIGQRLEELGKRANGFDVEVDPSTRKLRCWYPQQGVDRSSGEDAIVFDARNVSSTNVTFSWRRGTSPPRHTGSYRRRGRRVRRGVQPGPEGQIRQNRGHRHVRRGVRAGDHRRPRARPARRTRESAAHPRAGRPHRARRGPVRLRGRGHRVLSTSRPVGGAGCVPAAETDSHRQ